MNNRHLSLISVLLVSVLTACAASAQPADTLSQQYFNNPAWNPYPAQGTNGLTGDTCINPVTPAVMLNPEENNSIFGLVLPPTEQDNDLYLSAMPSGKRSGVFQKANFNALWSPKAGGEKGLGMTQLNLSAAFAFPLPSADSPFIITPSFGTTFFDPKTDGYMTKKTLYSTGLDFRWLKPVIPNKLTLDLGASAVYNGDFKVKASKAMRYPARIAAIWSCNPRLKIVGGIAYLDRSDSYNWFPIAGIIWTPHDDVSVELVAPRLRIAQRVRWFGSAADDEKQDWLYTALEFGGGTWDIEEHGYAENVEYRDIRLLLGYERRCAAGFMLGLELGYMFERKLEREQVYSTHPADSVFLRLRTSF
ncbi:MAG: hypothetical protein LBN39_03360 [Planctomycetaceae bacterium]|jgi:hypothetical protein|nr:hypothetical protein [Planctomycetaceae bacterium]